MPQSRTPHRGARRATLGPGRLVLWAGLILLACAPSAAAQTATAGGALRGQVVNDRTGAPVAAAFVEFMDGRTRIRTQATTDDEGRFILSGVPPGSFRLRVSRIGFRSLTTPYWTVKRGEILTVVVRIHTQVVPIAPLEIRSRARSDSPVLESFYDRMRTSAAGNFLSRDQIERAHASRVTELLEAFPSVRLEGALDLGRNERIVTFGARLGPGGGACPVQVFVDGVLASRAGPVSPDELASPRDLEGVELYRGMAGLPPEFVTPYAMCGVLALWTKRGG